ncbi:DUF305 domain-containing protein [Nocardia cyriacigeorgica]|nr:DUF305 domain-containing protein [Nocardia cyriacigeorgica]
MTARRFRIRAGDAAVVFAAAILMIFGGSVGYTIRGSAQGADSGLPSSHEVQFVRDMAAHHQQAIMLVDSLDPSADEGTARIARQIRDAQLFEVGQLRGWLQVWGENQVSEPAITASTPHHGAHAVSATADSHAIMSGMATVEEIRQLQGAHGTAAEKLFLQLMIRHHQGALAMAQPMLVDESVGRLVRGMAAKICADQMDEITLMHPRLQELGAQPLTFP